MKSFLLCRALLWLAAACVSTAVSAEMVLSQVIVDLGPDKAPRDDIEIWNSGTERMFVEAEPYEIESPGTEHERRIVATDPEASGLLVSPRRLVLTPGERRLVRIAMLGERPASDRVYRVAIKPVVGSVTADTNAVKVLVGYDALVIVRPATLSGGIVGDRRGKTLILRNEGNTSQEIFQGTQCTSLGDNCQDLPAKRLYPGNTWMQTLPYDAAPVSYQTAIAHEIRKRQF